MSIVVRFIAVFILTFLITQHQGSGPAFLISVIVSASFALIYGLIYPVNEDPPAPKISSPEPDVIVYPHNWAINVVTGNEAWLENRASPYDVGKGLGSKYPLPYNNYPYISQTWPHNDPNEVIGMFYRSDQLDHYDGHLYIGGNLYWDGQGHIITFGMNRSGKGTCLAVPALLSFPNFFPNAPTYIVLDPKGENLAICGKRLRDAGYNVVCINPFGIKEVESFGNAGFNVFDTFNKDMADFDKYVDMITGGLVIQEPYSNPHFAKTARSYIALYIRHMMTQDSEPKNFRTIYKWLRLAGPERMDLLENMGQNLAFDGDIADEAMAIAGQIMAKATEEVESTYSTIRTFTDKFRDRQLRDSISKSDFNITQIAHQKTAIFVCMAPSDMKENQGYLRILFGSFMRSLKQNYSLTRKTVMIMDEFVQMGYLEEFEIFSNVAAGLGAGITLWPIMQMIGDLKAVYPETWEKFLGNAVIQHFVKTNDLTTAEYVSKKMPIVTKIIEEGDKKKDIRDHTKEEPLYRPDEIMNFDDDKMIVFIDKVQKPAFFYKHSYLHDGFMKTVAQPNPYHLQKSV